MQKNEQIMIGGGGERKIGELFGILRAKHGKTDYTKMAAGPDAAENLRGMLRIITGGKRKNLLGKTKWTGKSGTEYHVDDFANLNFKNKEVFDDAVDILKQIQGSVSKLDGVKIWEDDHSWILLRPSGTEPLLRLFGESNDIMRLEKMMSQYSDKVKSIMKTLS